MQQRLTFVTIGTQNLDAMKSWYNKIFGWKPMKDSDGIVFYKLNGFIFGLYPANELAEDINIKNDGKGFKRMSFAINLNSEEEVNKTFVDFKKKGVTIIREPEKVFWGGYRGYIADPENNYWEFAYNPFLELDKDGNVKSHE